MAADNGSSNTAIVAIVVLVIVVLALAYYFFTSQGRPGRVGDGQSTIIERPTIIDTPDINPKR